MQVMVVSTGQAVYRITATTGGQLMAVTPGQPAYGLVSRNQSAYLSFVLPDDLSNLTLIVTVTNGASGLTLTAGPTSYHQTAALWSVVQQPGSDVLVFQLDYTDPLLANFWQIAGEYVAVLSSASDLIAFSAVYTITNGSVYDSSIVELQVGVPQFAMVAPNDYNFFYVTAPAAGWPYVLTINVVWAVGYGSVRALSSTNGAQVGPLSSDYSALLGGSTVAIAPGSARSCNPTSNTTCGYSISVEGGREVQSMAEYVIDVTVSSWVRTMYVGILRSPLPGAVLSVGESDYWKASVSVASLLINPQLLVSVAVTSGTVTVFASNLTSEPNATTAQLMWTDLSSTTLLAIPLQLNPNSIYFTVTCTSIDSTPCQYSLQAQRYDERQVLSVQTFTQSDPFTLLVPAGGMVWVAYSLWPYTTLGYLIAQAAVTLGTPSLYASCTVRAPNAGVSLANETYYRWQAVTQPLVIELFNFNVSAADCANIVLGVRASDGQAAQVDVSVTIAGSVQQLTGMTYGLSTPAYPVSYFQYTMTDSDPTSILSFTLAASGDNCTTSQLQMAVSDTVTYPDPSNPATYNFSRTAITLPNGATDLTIAISNYSQPAGSLHVGDYSIAVQSIAPGVTCQYDIVGSNSRTRGMSVDQLISQYVGSNRLPAYFTFNAWPYNTSTSFAVQLYSDSGVLMLYVAVDNLPSPADPSTYMLASSYNTSVDADLNEAYTAQPIYIPASACLSSTRVGLPCTVVFMAVISTPQANVVLMQPMSSAGATWLLQDQASLVDPASLSTTFQFNLPTSPLAVKVTVNSSSTVTIQCSYQYVTPDPTFHDWQAGSDNSGGYNGTTSLAFAWGAATANAPLQQVNAGTPLAASPTTCYCTVRISSFMPFSIAFSTTPLPSASSPSSHGLTGGALIAAVVVPIAAVLLLGGVWLWSRRSDGKCPDVRSQHGRSDGGLQRGGVGEEVEAREISMAELSVSRAGDGRLMRQQWQSDSV